MEQQNNEQELNELYNKLSIATKDEIIEQNKIYKKKRFNKLKIVLKNIIIFVFIFYFTQIIYAQSSQIEYIKQSSKPISFEDVLRQVKSFSFDNYFSNGKKLNLEEAQQLLFIDKYIVDEILMWLKNTCPNIYYGIDYNYPSTSHLKINCINNYSTRIGWYWGSNVWYWASNVNLMFSVGNETYQYEYSIPKFEIQGGNFNDHSFYNLLLTNITNHICNYSSNYSLNLSKLQTTWTENKIKADYINSNGKNIDAIYGDMNTSNKGYKLGLKMIDNQLLLICLDRPNNVFNDWDEGEIKALLEPTSSENVFKCNWIMADKTINSNCYITFEKNIMKISINGETLTYIQVYPNIEAYNEIQQNTTDQNVKNFNKKDYGLNAKIFSNISITNKYNNEDDININRVIITNKYTIIEITCNNHSKYAWYTIDKNTYIRVNGKKYILKKAEGIEISPNKSWFDQTGIANFTLYFPPIPKITKSLDLIENDKSPWQFYGIKLNL